MESKFPGKCSIKNNIQLKAFQSSFPYNFQFPFYPIKFEMFRRSDRPRQTNRECWRMEHVEHVFPICWDEALTNSNPNTGGESPPMHCGHPINVGKRI